jgi:aminoglycoside 3-N-acetyltransferase
MSYILLRIQFVKYIKKLLNIKNFTLYCRKQKQKIEKMIYRRKYTSDDIINILKLSGVTPGHPIIVHSAYSNLYNYVGTADELIDKLLEYIGPEGTLCMPAFPNDKRNPNNIFDAVNSKSAAGYLTEVFRMRPGVVRSLNQLHSVCALGKDAEKIVGDHHNSKICFDEKSPFYIIGELKGFVVNIGMPKWYVGTGEHVCEALLYDKLVFFKNKFCKKVVFTYKSKEGYVLKHEMLTGTRVPYVRSKSTKLFDDYFDKQKYNRVKISNLWITCYDMNYLISRLSELALKGITIYKSPGFEA